MTVWFISRHPGALDWLAAQGLKADRWAPHLYPEQLAAGDTVIGSLPINMVADLNARGVRYWHISLHLPPELRGLELSPEQLDQLGARLEEFEVHRKELPL